MVARYSCSSSISLDPYSVRNNLHKSQLIVEVPFALAKQQLSAIVGKPCFEWDSDVHKSSLTHVEYDKQ